MSGSFPDQEAEQRANDLEAVKRVAALSDGVFAIAITLLVLDLKLPDSESIKSGADLRSALASWSNYEAYVLSFMVIALYWVNHWRVFRRMARIDRPSLWLNMVLLMGIAFIPYPTSVLSEYGEYGTATAFYAGTLAVIGFVWAAFWIHSVRNGLLSAPGERDEKDERAFQLLFPPLVFLASILIAVRYPDGAKYFWLALLLEGWVFGVLRRFGLLRP